MPTTDYKNMITSKQFGFGLEHPRPVAQREIRFNRDLSGYTNLFNEDTYDHLLFDLHALGTYTHQYGEKALPMLPKRQGTLLRKLRHTFLNVYRRLFTVVFILNIVGFLVLLVKTNGWRANPPLSIIASASAGNLTVALLIRQEYIINTLYRTLWLVPTSAPLWLRASMAKVYEFGGVHSGAAICATLWFTILTILLTLQVIDRVVRDATMITVSYLLLSLLFTIVITAYPMFRFKSHNTFEAVHRWASWLSLALFWAEVMLSARLQVSIKKMSFADVLIREPSFWLLVVATCHTILPWLRLHRLEVRPEKLSDHAIRLHFNEPVPLFKGVRIAEGPLHEWHSFACIPNRDGGKSGGSVIVSNAGDWTKRTIQNPKQYYWIKGIPVTGVLCIARVFRSVVIVTTGSGIGPCLGVMQDIPHVKVRVIWSTRDPWNTYGKEVCQSVLEVDPNAQIIDTRFVRRPNLVQMAYQTYCEANAEAVCVISNPKLTREVVYGMETRGIPGFGPIWDS